MALTDLSDWISAWLTGDRIWYLKRLSGNDTLANKSHQFGPYVPKDLLFEVFPALGDETQRNPDLHVQVCIDSSGEQRTVRAIWYNNRFFGGTRNETRITNWGGASSAVLNADNTGALAAFVFPSVTAITREIRVWVCRNPSEEDLLEERFVPVEPSESVIWRPGPTGSATTTIRARAESASCYLTTDQMPPGWLTAFPSGADIVRKVCELRPAVGQSADQRLIRRRDCEFQLFQAVEEAVEGQRVTQGFNSVGEFLTTAQRILQRRKARSGRSLELQTREVFLEEGLIEGTQFSHGPESDPGKKPDFLFPSEDAYRNPAFPSDQLRLLAAKTTCKDRWRQVINEADRIATKHLLTLQEGISLSQYHEMKTAGIRLVVPRGLFEKYHADIQPELLDLQEFISSVQHLTINSRIC